MSNLYKVYKIKFSIYKCIWDQKKYIVAADVYLDTRIAHICHKLCYEFKIYTLDILEQICLLLHVSEQQYLTNAKKYKAVIKFDKYVQKNTCLFLTKKDAKSFIKNYLNHLLTLVYINGDPIADNISYIYNYK